MSPRRKSMESCRTFFQREGAALEGSNNARQDALTPKPPARQDTLLAALTALVRAWRASHLATARPLVCTLRRGPAAAARPHRDDRLPPVRLRIHDRGRSRENGKEGSDAENLSDIDDAEVDGYLHNEEETQNKKIIWEEMNKEYLEEQAAKEALAAELAARGVSVGEGRQKKRKRNEDKNCTPAETPAEATYNMLKRKGLGSKVNVEAVSGLYKVEDEDGKANGKDDMHFAEHYEEDTGYGETFDASYDYGHDADYNNDGYVDDGGGGAYEDYHDADY